MQFGLDTSSDHADGFGPIWQNRFRGYCAGDRGTKVGQPASVLKKRQRLPRMGAEEEHDSVTCTQAQLGIGRERTGDLYGKDISIGVRRRLYVTIGAISWK